MDAFLVSANSDMQVQRSVRIQPDLIFHAFFVVRKSVVFVSWEEHAITCRLFFPILFFVHGDFPAWPRLPFELFQQTEPFSLSGGLHGYLILQL